jgi:hypothetical protein
MEHYFVAVPEQHWSEGMDEMPLEILATIEVPPRTRFTKLPPWQSINKKDEFVRCLRNQKEYWEMQIAEEGAAALNHGNTMDEDRFDRYKQRVKACSVFLQVLQENPLPDDTRIFHGDKVDPSPHISNSDRETVEGDKDGS